VKALESKLYGSMEKLQSAKNEITSLINEIREHKENIDYLEIDNKHLKNEISTLITKNKDKLLKLRNKSMKLMSDAIKRIQSLKNDI
jgi:chromosome segregation ATPase